MAIQSPENCRQCRLAREGINPVSGEGRKMAPVMFIGRDPGVQENTLGRPFVGPSGKFLRAELEHFFDDSNYYITNLVKCHTKDNIGPTKNEMILCRGFLMSEIEEVRPAYIVALGKTVALALITDYFSIDNLNLKGRNMSEISGYQFVVEFDDISLRVVPTYHPSPRNMDKYDEIRRVIGMVAELVS